MRSNYRIYSRFSPLSPLAVLAYSAAKSSVYAIHRLRMCRLPNPLRAETSDTCTFTSRRRQKPDEDRVRKNKYQTSFNITNMSVLI